MVGFKLDRAEENIAADGPYTRFDGMSIRENRNQSAARTKNASWPVYPALNAQGVREVARPRPFVALAAFLAPGDRSWSLG